MGFLSGLLGGSEQKSESKNGLQGAPKWLQDIYQNTLAPDALSAYDKLKNPTYARVAAPQQGDIFSDPQLYALQLAADMRNGTAPQQEMTYSNGQLTFAPPSQQPVQQQGQPNQPQQGAVNQDAILLARSYLQNQASNPYATKSNAIQAQRYAAGQYDDNALAAIGQGMMQPNKGIFATNRSPEYEAMQAALNMRSAG